MTLFEKALDPVIATQDALRIALVPGDDIPTQRIRKHRLVNLSFQDLSGYPDAEARAHHFMRAKLVAPFPLYGSRCSASRGSGSP